MSYSRRIPQGRLKSAVGWTAPIFRSLKITLETPEFGSLRFNLHPLLASIQAIRSALFDQVERNRPS
jgi:hypothetical protein